MEFLSKIFKLTDEMIDFDGVADNGDSYFIPLKLDKVPAEDMKDPYCSDLISAIYILVIAMTGLSEIKLISRDVFGQACEEKWEKREGEVSIVQRIVRSLE